MSDSVPALVRDQFKRATLVTRSGDPVMVCDGPNSRALHNQVYLGRPLEQGIKDMVCPQPDESCVGCRAASKEGQPL